MLVVGELSCNHFSRGAISMLVLISFGLAIGGCGNSTPRSNKQRANVVIKLTYGGEPISAGDVDLNNLQTGEGGGGALDRTGTARIPGVVLGDYIVTVQPPISGAIPGADTAIAKTNQIAKKYQSPEKSPLKITVPAEGKEATFDLKE
jgi:hypothetical protein